MAYKRYILLIIILVIAVLLILIFRQDQGVSPVTTPSVSPAVSTIASNSPTVSNIPVADVSIIATGLNIPWDMAFLPDGSFLVTERVGNLVKINGDGSKTSIKLPHPVPKGEGGLLGITLHPQFNENYFLYLYMTTNQDSVGTKNAVFRYRFSDGQLLDEKLILKNIPGAIYHDGGRVEFGPDGLLYITTGDATTADIAQDPKSLGGKILRVKDDGSVPEDNPFGTAVYSYGHRNPQGLTWDSRGRLWSTEHGRSGVTSGMDELNMIEQGGNYGWPKIEGDKTASGMITPIINSGPDITWAPASALYYKGSIFFGGLKGESLYRAILDESRDDGKVVELKSYFHNEYGRIRTVRLGPDGMFYLTTSNRDDRGSPTKEDDRIIRVNPRIF